jgi:hypothetical protein
MKPNSSVGAAARKSEPDAEVKINKKPYIPMKNCQRRTRSVRKFLFWRLS